jgi:diamine N-acetyltransferase
MPVIARDNIQLRAVERTDLPRFVAWLNDPEVTAGLGLFAPLSLVNEERWFERTIALPPEQQPMVIEVLNPLGDNPASMTWFPVGNCSFHEIDWRNRSAEIGIFIGEKAYWNRGIGTRVMRLMVEYGFNTLNLHRIWLRVLANNLRAIRSYEKVGFVHEGCKREAEIKHGHYIDLLLMSILDHEFRQQKEG